MRGRIITGLWLTGLVILAPWLTPSASRGEQLPVCYGALAIDALPLWTARESGLLRKVDLEVPLLYVEGGSRAAQAMVGGSIPICLMGGSPVVSSNLAGSGLVMIAAATNVFPFVLATTQGISRVEQLRGKMVGISRFGSSSDVALRYALQRLGINPEREVTFIQVGGLPTRFAALIAGSIQATLLGAEGAIRARKLGLPVLADLGELGIEYPSLAVAASRAYLRQNRALVKRFLLAYVEAIHVIKTRQRETIPVIAKYLRTGDEELLAELYRQSANRFTLRKPYPTVKGTQVVLDELAKSNPRAKGARPEEFIDASILKEIDDSGFIDGLYR